MQQPQGEKGETSNKMKKMLLMGRSGAGKTSMHSIIFANYPAHDTAGIGFTVDIEEQKIKFLGQLTLNLWDCGGQDKLMRQWFSTQKELIFKNVEVLIYVFDVENEGKAYDDDVRDYKLCIQNLQNYSTDSKVFVLIHKLDKIRENDREATFNRKQESIKSFSQGVTIKGVYGTSIWDETLYNAWSQIVQYLIPDLEFIKDSLRSFCSICDCDEIVLFEKQTFLIISYYETSQQKNILKYERVSNIIKQFKLSCHRIGSQIKSIIVKNANFTAVIQEFTSTTYIMVVFKNIPQGAIEFNIENARKLFEKNKNEQQNLVVNWEK